MSANRPTRAELIKLVETHRREANHPRESVRYRVKERDDAQAMYEAEKTRHAATYTAMRNITEQLQGDRERDREALLTAENRIVALEDAIVSLAVRVA